MSNFACQEPEALLAIRRITERAQGGEVGQEFGAVCKHCQAMINQTIESISPDGQPILSEPHLEQGSICVNVSDSAK